MNTNAQRIIWPWTTKKWAEVFPKVTGRINNIIELDTILTLNFAGKIRPRLVVSLFNTYADEQYSVDRVSTDTVINEIVPFMQKLIKDATRTFKEFLPRALVPGVETNIVFTRLQAATIISCMWFGLFNYNYLSEGDFTLDSFPEPSFINIFMEQNVFALQCLLTYFVAVRKYAIEDTAVFEAGSIIIKRAALSAEPDWINSDAPVCGLRLGSTAQVDKEPTKLLTAFAHEYIGGDMFKTSMTQEEIFLMIFPECLLTTLFCAALRDNESVIVYGAEKISEYTGYGSSVRFTGRYHDTATRGYSADDTEVMLQRAIIFIDAGRKTSMKSQFIDDFMRDLNKVYCGYSAVHIGHGEPIVGGNWTYGFNGNNIQVKLLQQILAASQTGNSLVYCPTGGDLAARLQEYIFYFQNNTSKFTVGALISAYIRTVSNHYSSPASGAADLDLIMSIIQQILF